MSLDLNSDSLISVLRLGFFSTFRFD
jgi:hypothetical protein